MVYLGYLKDISTQLGTSLWLLVIILIWTFFWKICALWKSARDGKFVWFLFIMLFNTVGILPILYIYVFSKIKKVEKKPIKKKAVKKKIVSKKAAGSKPKIFASPAKNVKGKKKPVRKKVAKKRTSKRK